MLVQVVLQRVPAATHADHHVAPQHLWEPVKGRSQPVPEAWEPSPGAVLRQPLTLTRTKMSRLESPTRYLPSDTLIMGNWSGQVQWPRISRTCGQRAEAGGQG